MSQGQARAWRATTRQMESLFQHLMAFHAFLETKFEDQQLHLEFSAPLNAQVRHMLADVCSIPTLPYGMD